jgi:nucleoside-diphosphate-sugar epimerase
MRVLITGATGFVGKALVPSLTERGWTVFRGIRSQALARERADGMTVSLNQATGHFEVRAPIDAVIHLAAIAHTHGVDPRSYRIVNAIWPQKLAMRAAALRIPHFLFISTAKVVGDSLARPADETSTLRPADAYAASKAEAEALLDDVGRQTGLRITVIRPPLVYGPGVGANFHQLLRIVDAGWPLPFASVNNRRSLIYVGNLASAIEASLKRSPQVNRTFFVSDDHDLSTPELVTAVAASLRKQPRLFAFPPNLLRFGGRLLGKGDRIARLLDSMQVDISRIRTELGWRPPISMEQGLAETALWYRSRHQ